MSLDHKPNKLHIDINSTATNEDTKFLHLEKKFDGMKCTELFNKNQLTYLVNQKCSTSFTILDYDK